MWEMGKDRADIFRRKKQVKDKILFAIRLANSVKVGHALCQRGCGKAQALRGGSVVGVDDAAIFLEGS